MPTTAGTDSDEPAAVGSSSGMAPRSDGADAMPTASLSVSGQLGDGELFQLADGADAGVARYCERFFVSPESARSGSKALLTAFEHNGVWLSSLVQPGQLVAEVRQSCCALTSHVIVHWINQGETHKLARFADALLEATPPLTTHEAGQIMALVASLLGILRPQRAQHLLSAALPLLDDPVDTKLRDEAHEWVDIGRHLHDAPPDERLLWNRRLREPEEDWEWESDEARAALKRVSPLLKDAMPSSSRFEKLVPGCWWDLLHETPAATPPAPAPVLEPIRRRSAFGSMVFGAILGVGLTVATGWWFLQDGKHLDYPVLGSVLVAIRSFGAPPVTHPAPPTDTAAAFGESTGSPTFGAQPQPATGKLTASLSPNHATPVPTTLAGTAPSTIPAAVSSAAKPPPARDTAVAPSKPTPQLAPTAKSSPAIVKVPPPLPAKADLAAVTRPAPVMAAPARPVSQPAPPADAATWANSPAADPRLAAAADLAKRYPHLQRLHKLVKWGAYRENEALVSGRSSLVPASGRDHSIFLRWLLLDPPQDGPTATMVAKLATRVMAPEEMFPVLELISYPGSPNAIQAREIAGLLLSLENGSLSEAQRGTLQSLATSNP